MTSELFLRGPWLWTCVWQSTMFITLGLAGTFLLKHRSSRAHQVLLLSMIAAVIIPAAGLLVKHYELGVFVAEPAVIRLPNESQAPMHNREVPEIVSSKSIEHESIPIEQAAEPTMTGSRDVPFSWRLVLLYSWIAASVVLAGRLIVMFLLGLRLLHRATSLDCERIEHTLYQAKVKLGIRKDVKVYSSRGVRSPVIWCWGRSPILLVPSAAWQADIDWTGVLCHELAHLKRRDHISGLLAELAVCILPWQLLLWLGKSRLIHLSEQACDDWVVATDQTGTDYAESLLDLTPSGRMALVPAVVSTKRGLAGRVRRILEDKCANPRTGLRWSLTTAVIVSCIALGVAFAQTRPAQPAATIKTKIGQTVVIEESALPAIKIKGRVIRSDDDPKIGPIRIKALPSLSAGAIVYPDNKDGNFELTWSPAWIEEGQPIRIVASAFRRGNGNSAYVEVSDPTQPVMIQLESSGISISANVTDPSGQSITLYDAELSLATDFKCRAPIFCNIIDPGETVFSGIPHGPNYTLTIQADGFQIKQVVVDSTDKYRNHIDLGTIVLHPQDSLERLAIEQNPTSDAIKEFHKIYRLDEGEIIKLITPPFVLGRQEYFRAGISGGTWFKGNNFFRWDGKPIVRIGSTGTGLDYIFYLLSDIPAHDFEFHRGMKIRLPEGDWIVRSGVPITEQLAALEAYLQAELHRLIHFEKRTIEREVIVVRGRYEFKPHPSGDHPDYIPVTYDGRVRSKKQTANSLGEFLRFIETQTEIKIINETEPAENTIIRYKMGPGTTMLGARFRKSELLNALVDNLSKTTSLQFTVERRPAEVWCVTEETKN